MPAVKPAANDLDPIETASRDEIAVLQLQRLRSTLQRTPMNDVPHYRRRPIDANGREPGRPEAVRRTSSKFPFTVKKDLRDNYPFGMFAVPRDAGRACCTLLPARPASPRSSATPKNDIVQHGPTWSHDRFAPPAAAAGDIIQVAYGYGLFTGGLGAHYGAEKPRLHGDPDVRRADRKAGPVDPATCEPKIIMVTPSYMQVIIEELTAPAASTRVRPR